MADAHKISSFGFAGSGEVDAGNAERLLNDLLPQDYPDGTAAIGGIYRPAKVPRSAQGLNAAVTWLENELGKRNVHGVDDLIETLAKRRDDDGDEVTLVMVWPAEPSDDDKELVLRARGAGIRVLDLAAALDTLTWEPPAPEVPEEAAPAEALPVEEVAAHVAGVIADEYTEMLITGLTGMIRDVVIQVLSDYGYGTGPSAPAPPPVSTVASGDQVSAVAAKLAAGRKAPVELPDGDEPPFDTETGTVKPANAVFRAESGAGSPDEEQFAFYMDPDGKYRRAKSRPKRGDTRVMLTAAQIDDLVQQGLVTDS